MRITVTDDEGTVLDTVELTFEEFLWEAATSRMGVLNELANNGPVAEYLKEKEEKA